MSTRRLFLKILMCLTNLIPSVRNDWKAIARNICSALFVEMQLIPKKLILRLMRSKRILPAMPLSRLLMLLLMRTFVKWKSQPLNCSSNTGTSKYFNFLFYIPTYVHICTHTITCCLNIFMIDPIYKYIHAFCSYKKRSYKTH